MQFKTGSFYNVWYVDNRGIDNIVIFDNVDGGRILLDMQQRWIGWGYGGNAIGSLDDVEHVELRRSVDLSRAEHFYTAIKANKYVSTTITLYINAALFNGYSTVNRLPSHSDEFDTTYRNCLEIFARVDGEKEPRWIKLWAGGEQYERETSPLGQLCDQVMALYNEKVADHSNRQLSRSGAKRLLDTLPALQSLLVASGLRQPGPDGLNL